MDSSDGIVALIDRARAGEANAFAQIVRRYFKAAYAVALAVLGNPCDAEDIAQDSLVVAFEQLDQCRNPERFLGWLTQIARNRALNALQSRKTAGLATERLSVCKETSLPLGETTVLRLKLLKALEQIPASQREVVLLHDLHGSTHAEISEALGVSEVMSRQLLFQARKVLRAFLEESEPKEVADVTRE